MNPPTPTEYLDQLTAQLELAGIRGAHRRRIVTEFADHLECDPQAHLGDPRTLATQFADELGTSFARTAAFRAFGALALCGALIVLRAATFGPLNNAGGQGLDTIALMICVVAAQVAFVAGGLGLVRALRLRGRDTIGGEEAAVLARRAGVGLLAGAITTFALPVMTSVRAHESGGVTWIATAAMGVGLAAIGVAAPAVIRAARLRPQAGGPAGDLLADLGPLQPTAARLTGGSSTRFALLFAGALAVVIALAGAAGQDPYDGILRGVLEGGACLAGFATLGRYLGLRR